MRIAVCVKQVPVVQDGAVDMDTGLLLRAGLEPVSNPHDLPALETALLLKEKTCGSAGVFTMGPQSAEQVLLDAFAVGADVGWLVCDPAFAGADVPATAYTLMQALHAAGGFDCVICGSHTTDGDTGFVGTALAQWLEIPCLRGVTGIVETDGRIITVECEREDERSVVRLECPCLLTVSPSAAALRMPTFAGRMSTGKKAVHRITLAVLADTDPSHYGLRGSATHVKRTYPPPRPERRQAAAMNGRETAAAILAALEESL